MGFFEEDESWLSFYDIKPEKKIKIEIEFKGLGRIKELVTKQKEDAKKRILGDIDLKDPTTWR